MKASIVLGLQWGDEGKGRTVDYLSSFWPETSMVVRFSGGQNCGHTVIHNGIKHIFSSFGSGTLRGVPTYVSEHCTAYLISIDNERRILINKGITPKLYLHPLTMLTTPYDVAYNRVMSKITNHGSVGVGINTTMKRHLTTGYKLYAQDLLYPKIFLAKLEKIKEYYYDKIELEDKFRYQDFINELGDSEKSFIQLIDKELFYVDDYNILKNSQNLIFEGSQGIMLDMDHGIFPNVTYANTTSKNAIEICNKLNINDVDVFYITRCYQTRHGNGWMSNRDLITLINNEEEINVENFQGEFRVGELDYDILNYSLMTDHIYLENLTTKRFLSKMIVVTCLDQRPDFQFDSKSLKYPINFMEFNKPNN